MRRITPLTSLVLLLAACGSDTTSNLPANTTAVDTTAVDTTAVDTTAADAADSAVAGSTSTTGSEAMVVDGSIVNTWVGPAADLTALPIGTSSVSAGQASIGGLFACDAGNPNGGGAFVAGPWIDEVAGTWDLTSKVAVSGEISWPTANYSETVEGDSRVISSNGLPLDTITGAFPIAADDEAYSYDRNPNSIGEVAVSITLPISPTAAATPSCLPKGTIGVFKNGVAAFASVDELNRDAVAYETQDVCDGHPEMRSTYHYHNVPVCLVDAAVGSSTVVGFAYDGFPIVVERDAAGNLPTNADLDECHGRTSPINLDGAVVEMYHYSATYEFPYFIGCFHGTTA